MVHNELHALDLAIIGAYLIAMVLIGLVVVKKVRSMDDYYLGGRSFGPLVLMATVCATIIGGSGLMGRAGVAYSSGFKAIMTALPYLLGMFIFSGFASEKVIFSAHLAPFVHLVGDFQATFSRFSRSSALKCRFLLCSPASAPCTHLVSSPLFLSVFHQK